MDSGAHRPRGHPAAPARQPLRRDRRGAGEAATRDLPIRGRETALSAADRAAATDDAALRWRALENRSVARAGEFRLVAGREHFPAPPEDLFAARQQLGETVLRQGR